MRRSTEGFTGTLIVILLGTSFIIGGMLGGLFGGGLILWATAPRYAATHATPTAPPTETPTPRPAPTETPIETITPTATPVIIATPSVADVVDDVLPAVVTVINRHPTGTSKARTVGSGVVIDAAGYIITNAHVAGQAQTLTVSLADGTNYPAKIITLDTTQDLALLKISANAPLPTVRWGDSNGVRMGQPVLAIGAPLGDFPNSVTMGIISGLDRALAYDDVVLYGLLQTDAAINQGNSGGPLINLQGEVVGINTFIIRADNDNKSVAEGIGFAIPASAVKLLSSTWMAHTPDAAAAGSPGDTNPLPAGQSSP